MSSPQPKGVADAIDAYYAALPRQNSTTQIAGVRVICPPDEGSISDIRRKYERDRENFDEYLGRSRAKAVAFVPKALWNRVIERNGLVDFGPDRNGYIDVSFSEWTKAIGKWETRLFLMYLLVPTFLFEIWVWFLISRTHSSTPGLDHSVTSVLTACASFVVLFFGGMFYSKSKYGHEDAAFRRMAARILLRAHPNSFAEAILAGPKLEANHKGYNGNTRRHLQMILPRAPEGVGTTLRAMDEWSGMRFALDPATLTANRPVEDLYLMTWNDKVMSKFRVSARVADENFGVTPAVEPILFGYIGEAVAILGTYAPVDLERLLKDAVNAPVGNSSGRALKIYM